MTSTSDSKPVTEDGLFVRLSYIETPIGTMLAGTIGGAVCLLRFTDADGASNEVGPGEMKAQVDEIERKTGGRAIFERSDAAAVLSDQLASYFEGTRRTFHVPLYLRGTPFQKRVWQALTEIPYGEVRSYGLQARAVGNVDAVRAVARANGDNPIAIVVPCHRVIGSDGSLTGYAGGLWRKKYLLELERGRQGDLFATGGI
ncbi:MAG: methylated-DNA--[protein]-cysteine S-methyltransferase [Rhodothermales bacterium]